MTREQATTIITSEIIRREINNIEELFSDRTRLLRELRYNKTQLNNRLQKK